MTIPEAVSLVLQAGALADGERIFLLDMGEPASILGLARQMIRLAGLRPDDDIPIQITGPRPGERLHERLTTRPRSTNRPTIPRSPSCGRSSRSTGSTWCRQWTIWSARVVRMTARVRGR